MNRNGKYFNLIFDYSGNYVPLNTDESRYLDVIRVVVITIDVIVIVLFLLSFRISVLLRIDSEEPMVFHDGHPAKYWPPTNVRAVCVYCFAWYLL